MKLITLADGRQMWVLIDDNGISEELERIGTHEIFCTNILKGTLKEGMCVLEIGANLGYYAMIEAKIVGKSGVVHAVEPVIRNYECLQKNLEFFDNCFVYNSAIGEYTGLAVIKTANFSNSATIMSDEKSSDWYKDWFGAQYMENQQVQMYTLDDFSSGLPRIDMIRMDVEGYETDIISHGTRTLEAMSKGSILFMEIHPVCVIDPETSIVPMMDYLWSIGFRPIYVNSFTTKFPKIKAKFLAHEMLRGAWHCPHIFMEKK